MKVLKNGELQIRLIRIESNKERVKRETEIRKERDREWKKQGWMTIVVKLLYFHFYFKSQIFQLCFFLSKMNSFHSIHYCQLLQSISEKCFLFLVFINTLEKFVRWKGLKFFSSLFVNNNTTIEVLKHLI